MKFNQMTDEEKLKHLRDKLEKSREFREKMGETGFTCDSFVCLTKDEFEWIMQYYIGERNRCRES